MLSLAPCFIVGAPHALAHYEHAGECSANETGKRTKMGKRNKSRTSANGVVDPWDVLIKALTPSAMAAAGSVQMSVEGNFRYIRSDGIPDHATGAFPNRGNPNTISEQEYVFRMPLHGELTGSTVAVHMGVFGVAVNGIPFDPAAAEWWNRDPYSGWQYEAMYLGPRLGLDQNNAHVQPNGAYHYHGIPVGLLDKLGKLHKPVLLGYAADGFPIYGPYGYRDSSNASSGLKELGSGFRLKLGHRSSDNDGPGGVYDGAFTQDYEWVPASLRTSSPETVRLHSATSSRSHASTMRAMRPYA